MSNANYFTDASIIEAINNINQQLTHIKSIYGVKYNETNISMQENISLNEIQNSIENIVESIEPKENCKTNSIEKIKSDVYKYISTVEDNDTLLISSKEGKIFLPYTVNELKAYLTEYPNEYKSLSDVVNQEYIVSIDRYKNQAISRFKEMYSLMRDIEMKSIIESFKKAVEIMFDRRINPAIIAACKSEEQLYNYIYCLDRNDLSNFKDFKIVFDVVPLNDVASYEFEWEERVIKSKRRARRYK